MWKNKKATKRKFVFDWISEWSPEENCYMPYGETLCNTARPSRSKHPLHYIMNSVPRNAIKKALMDDFNVPLTPSDKVYFERGYKDKDVIDVIVTNTGTDDKTTYKAYSIICGMFLCEYKDEELPFN